MSMYESLRFKGKIKKKYRKFMDKFLKCENITGYGNKYYGRLALDISYYGLNLLEIDCFSVIGEEYEKLFPWEPFENCNRAGGKYESYWDINTGELIFAISYNVSGRAALDTDLVDLLILVSSQIESFEAVCEDWLTLTNYDNKEVTQLYSDIKKKNFLKFEVVYGKRENTTEIEKN